MTISSMLCRSKLKLRLNRLLLPALAFIALSGAAAKLDALPSNYPIQLGSPQRVSPIPGPANPDPILQNLPAVMDNHYQLPTYPGGYPNYLSQILIQTNTYFAHQLVFNPLDDRIMLTQIGQNMVYDFTFTFVPFTIGTNVIASSIDRGSSWKQPPLSPIEQIIPLGGTISQIINSSEGPGLYLSYGKNGRLYASGHGFMDMVANPPFQVPMTGFLFTHSDDNGRTWAPLKKVLESDVNWWILNGPNAATGLGPREFYTTLNPANNNIIYASTMFPLFPAQIWSSLYFFSSHDEGENWSPPREVYNIFKDPVWQANYFDPDFTSDPNYFIFGGSTLSSAHPFVVNQNVLLLPLQRSYPKVGATTYTNTPQDTSWDQAVVRSLDNGKTWLPAASVIAQYIASLGCSDPGFVDPLAGGGLGVFSDSTQHGVTPIVSPFTGRLYFTYEAGNTSLTPDLDLVNYLPQVVVSASSDQGATWSESVPVSRTPTNIPYRAQQAFAHAAAMTLDGYYVVAYYDFRNWTGFTGEDIETTPLPTDVWLDIYRETPDPRGGSTGIGLDFVKEIRVTPQSFNGRVMSESTPAFFGATSSFFMTGTNEGMSMCVNSGNVLSLLFSMANENDPSKVQTDVYRGLTTDTNNRMNIFIQRYQFAKPSNR